MASRYAYTANKRYQRLDWTSWDCVSSHNIIVLYLNYFSRITAEYNHFYCANCSTDTRILIVDAISQLKWTAKRYTTYMQRICVCGAQTTMAEDQNVMDRYWLECLSVIHTSPINSVVQSILPLSNENNLTNRRSFICRCFDRYPIDISVDCSL